METINILQVTPWNILDASVAGTSHQKAKRGCEDKYHFDVCENGTLIIAVADGAGSATHGSDGAQYVVDKALEIIKSSLAENGEPDNLDEWHDRLYSMLAEVHTSLKEMACRNNLENNILDDTKVIEPLIALPSKNTVMESELKHSSSPLPLREYATTLLVSVITSRWVATVQIGDGIVVIQDSDGKLQSLTKPDHGEYINETNFITDPNYSNHLQFCILSEISVKSIAMLTDGLQMLALDFATNLPHEPFFLPLFEITAIQTASQKELENFLVSERVCERTDDDKTIVLAVRS